MLPDHRQDDPQKGNGKRVTIVKVPMEPALKHKIEKYAAEHHIGVGTLLRGLARHFLRFYPPDSPPLPRGIETEKKRPSRRSRSEAPPK